MVELDDALDVAAVGVEEVCARRMGGAAVCTHTCALVAGQGIWRWGSNRWGQLGDGSMAALRAIPVRAVGL